ncbi:hypothetical protein CEXT_757911 [Caerostris extrusa]|uniref:Uncharacterized protein n=1 Tax=Caerostris extrusa TaxID=172846 RepID=A0AAV4P6D4_CAEEX|nr:hypothetical protein CEXT_757911 [Caerostris extrusa]
MPAKWHLSSGTNSHANCRSGTLKSPSLENPLTSGNESSYWTEGKKCFLETLINPMSSTIPVWLVLDLFGN